MAGPDAAITPATSEKEAASKSPADPWYIEHPVRAIAACFGLAVVVAGLWAVVVYRHGSGAVDGGPVETYGLGTFGDAFGPIAALFNAAALAAALVAVVLQRRELAMQREEMALAREEMAAQREEMHGQRAAAERHAAAIERANELAELQMHESRAGNIAAALIAGVLERQVVSAQQANLLTQVAVRVEAARLAFDAEAWAAAAAKAPPAASRLGEVRAVSEYFRSGRAPVGDDIPTAETLRKMAERTPEVLIGLQAHAEATRVLELLETFAKSDEPDELAPEPSKV